MKFMTTKKIQLSLHLTITCLLFVFLQRANAQEQKMVYSLDQVIEAALEGNRNLKAQREQLHASDWNVKKAYSEFLPKVDFNQNLTRVDDLSVRNANFAIEGIKSFPGFENADIPPILFKDTYGTSLGVTLPVYQGGRLRNGLEIAKIGRESDRLNVLDNESEIILQVSNAYYDLLKNKEFLKIRQSSLDLAKSNLKNAQAKNELGLRPKSDILRWEAQIATDESNLLEAQNILQISKVTLANIMGIELLSDFDVEVIPQPEFAKLIDLYRQHTDGPVSQKMEELFSIARDGNYGRQNIALQKDLSETSVKQAKSTFLPNVNLSYNYSWQPNDTPSLDGFRQWNATLNFSYSLFKGFGDWADISKAKAELRQSERFEEDFDRNLKVSIFTAYQNIRTALAKIKLAEKNLIQTMDNLQLITNRYNLGLASNIDQIDAQVLESTSEVNLISAKYDLLIAGAQLNRALGKSFLQNK